MNAARPRRTPMATWVALAAALVPAGIALVAAQHFAAEHGWTSGGSWLRAGADALREPRPGAWVFAAGVAAAVVGLAFLIAACVPARRTHLPVEGVPELWISPRALAAIAEDAAERVPGVLAGRGSVKRRRIRVGAVTAPGAAADTDAVRDAVARRIAGLSDFDVSVDVKGAGR